MQALRGRRHKFLRLHARWRCIVSRARCPFYEMVSNPATASATEVLTYGSRCVPIEPISASESVRFVKTTKSTNQLSQYS
jgi:hypothetical protein